MGCAIILDKVGFDIGSQQEKFNGVMLRIARESEAIELEKLAEISGIRYSHLVEIEEGLCQPTEWEIHRIMEVITPFLKKFYYCKTYIKEKPDVVFACGSGIRPCANCGQVADFLCDYPVGEGKTCDLPICSQCRTHVGKYDFCPVHGERNKVVSVI